MKKAAKTRKPNPTELDPRFDLRSPEKVLNDLKSKLQGLCKNAEKMIKDIDRQNKIMEGPCAEIKSPKGKGKH